MERNATTAVVSRSDEQIDYMVNVKNISAGALGSVASAGDEIFCAGEYPLKEWAPSAPNRPQNSIEWLRNGVAIAGATSNFYTLTAVDEGKAIQCLVKGENSGGALVESSLPASVVNPQPATALPAPITTGNPTNPGWRPTVVGSGTAATARKCAPPTNWTGLAFASATVTSGSTSLTAVSPAPFAVGQQITGKGIPAGTTITVVGTGTLTLSAAATESGATSVSAQSAATGSTTTGSRTITSTGSLQFAVGEEINAPGIPSGATVTVVESGTLEISVAATATASGVPLAGATAGRWAFQWLRNSQPISGATTYAYQPSGADEGTVLQCRTIATNAGGSVLVASNEAGVGTVTKPPTNIPADTPVTVADPTTVTFEAPGGLESLVAHVYEPGNANVSTPRGWLCQKVPASTSKPAEAVCLSYESVAAGSSYNPIAIGVVPGADAPDLALARATVSGGGASEAVSSTANEFTFNPFEEFGLSAFEAKIAANGTETSEYTQAGGHPVAASVGFTLTHKRNRVQSGVKTGEAAPLHLYENLRWGALYTSVKSLRSVVVDTPRGFVGNALSVPELCSSAQAVKESYVNPNGCPPGSKVGGIVIGLGPTVVISPIYAIEPEFGKTAEFAFTEPSGNLFVFTPELRPDEGYAISMVASPSPEVGLLEARPTLCGYGLKELASSPALRVVCKAPGEAGANPVPLLTNPTRCSGPVPVTGISVDSWGHPGDFKHYETTTPAMEGCEAVPFEPQMSLEPTSHRADAPTGMNIQLTMPTEGLESPSGISQADLDNATVVFPEGMSVNPASAAGLGGCTQDEVKMGSNEEAECPHSSQIGTVEVTTPLLQETLTGAVYLAEQNENPFKTTIGLYLVFESKKAGITIKVAGKLVPNPVTGRLTAKFTENPADPFSKLVLHFNEGPRAPLVNSPACGTYAIHSELSPWSAANPAEPTPAEIVSHDSTDQVSEGPGGGPCPSDKLEPKLTAGLQSPVGGSTTPFVMDLSREDGTQRFTALNLTLPKGLFAYLKGVPYCSDSVLASIPSAEGTGRAQLANPSCPAGSQVGTVEVGVGSGPDPFYTKGWAYFAGPYKGAPFSIAIVMPAVAGPFDLGSVVVRSGLYVDPRTAQVTVKSDPIPTILDGILLDVRDIRVNVDKPDYIVAPTNCETMSVDAQVGGEQGASATASSRFQVGGCAGLKFKPVFKAATSAKTSRNNGASLTVKLAQAPGEANIHRVKVELPKALPSRLTTLQKACTEQQFSSDPAGCPAASKVGMAVAHTPILQVPLAGPAYFVSHGGAKFPELILVLQGDGVTINLAGETFISKTGVTSSTFAAIPDAPVESFELNLPIGPYSALAANGDLCSKKLVMPTEFTGQNGVVTRQNTKIAVSGCTKTKQLTKAQKLKSALKACKKLKSKTKRASCERQARKKYGTTAKTKK